MKTKIQALAKYLNVSPETLNEGYRNDLFEFNDEEYIILTDSEATKEATEEIMQSLWAFRTSWITSFIQNNEIELNASQKCILDNLEFYQQDLCEDANSLVEELIEGYESEFIKQAIEADKRGHFISRYDGLEVPFEGYFIYRTN